VAGLPGPFSFLRPLGVVGGTAIGFAVGHGVSPAIRPVIQDLANQAWELHQVRPLEPSIAAQLVAEGLWDYGQGAAEAARSGINAGRFDLLVAEARTGPTIEQAFVGVQRGILDGAEFERAMRQADVRPEWDELMRLLVEVLPSVTDSVRFAVREAYDEAASAELDLDAEFPPAFGEAAGKLGLSERSARLYWRAHWDLPSFTQLVQMLFRRQLSPAEFSRALKAIDFAPTWRSKLEVIARPIPPLSDMIRFAVRDVYSPDTVNEFGLDDDFPAVFAEEASLHGMQTPYPQQYWRAHWRLPSALQGYRMLWRGEITPAQLDKLLKALDYPPFWRQRLSNIARIVPGRIDLKRMLRHGIKDRDEVLAGYRRLGYADADAEFMTQIAEAEVETAAPGETFVSRARSSLFNRLRTEYVSRQLSDSEALAGMAAASVPAAQRDRVLTLWRFERNTVRTELTQAQIVKAFKKGEYDEAEALAELVERGMTPEDAGIRLRSG
jgi:hypothetical protein